MFKRYTVHWKIQYGRSLSYFCHLVEFQSIDGEDWCDANVEKRVYIKIGEEKAGGCN